MKKTAIALVIAGLAAASVQAAPQANTFYVGAKAGWASFHDGLNKYSFTEPGKDHTIQRNFVTYGVFGGYQITDNFAVELGYDDFGRAKFKTNGELTDKHTAHGAHLSLKASYPVLEGLDVYARVGAALIRSDYKTYGTTDQAFDEAKGSSTKVSPVFAGGVEYSLPSLPELALRLEYQWVNNVGKLVDATTGSRFDYRPDIGSLSLGVSYRFGQGVAPVAVSKTVSLSSDVTFAFGKANLKPEAQGVLDGVYGEIAQLSDAKVAVAGYTDRIGSEASNLVLSQRRADTVANYLVSKGVAQTAISATGYGEANPKTGNSCDAVTGRKALIACLAQDRRVEISYQGTK